MNFYAIISLNSSLDFLLTLIIRSGIRFGRQVCQKKVAVGPACFRPKFGLKKPLDILVFFLFLGVVFGVDLIHMGVHRHRHRRVETKQKDTVRDLLPNALDF